MRLSQPADVMASYTFMSFGLPTLPLFFNRNHKDKGNVRGERKINFQGPNRKHNPQFVNCLETFEGRIKEMKSRTYRNIAA